MQEMTDEVCKKFLDNLKEEKIKFCKQYNISIPNFDKIEDYKILPLRYYGIDEVITNCKKCPSLESCITHITDLSNDIIKCITYQQLEERVFKVFFKPLYNEIIKYITKECVGEENVSDY